MILVFCFLSGRPNSNLIFIPIILSTGAFILSVVSASWCDFVAREIDADVDVTLPARNRTIDGVFSTSTDWGLWSVEYQGLCYVYSDSFNFDAMWNTARAMSAVSVVFGGIIMVATWLTSCMGVAPNAWRLLGVAMLFTCLFEGLKLLTFRSDICNDDYEFTDGQGGSAVFSVDCVLDTGSKLCIASTCSWFVCGLSVCKMPPPKEIEFD